MQHEHTVKSFDDELKQLDSMIAEMGGMAEANLAGAVDAMVRRDTESALVIKKADKKIDALEIEIDDHAVRILALRQPMADDLRAVIVALKTAAVIERIGDFAKNIAKRTQALSQCPDLGAAKTIKRMAGMAQNMMTDVLDAYVTRDADKADEVRLRDEELDSLYTSLFRELLTYMMENPKNITASTHLMFAAKNIERIGDHATNIAENVHFLVHGQMPEEPRPKGDGSVYMTDPTADV
ncbi:MAG: phosphate transport system regulatory protein PhoU [Magnetovibrio sp.]|nr:phosphate transport system regulatory protein PhoU [Magnetovibrio sp.]MEC9151563.1 phosphate signaling complex protein PhoU [Pseudomonadota bacterium]|tara:strand:+ start:812 stop:1528 length:717 start_codon:yes stop_codon:yes gene_type:complete